MKFIKIFLEKKTNTHTMENADNESTILLNEKEFIKVMAGNQNKVLINEHNFPLEDLINPLTHSMKVRKHEDMQAIPVGYKFNRDFKKLFEELKK
jgi:hypothetical protein